MRRLIFLALPFLLTSCYYNDTMIFDEEVVVSVNIATKDRQWRPENKKYIVRTECLTVATDSLYKVGDTLVKFK